MSLIEQAIARIKQQGGSLPIEHLAQRSPHRPVVGVTVPIDMPEANASLRVDIDMVALRASGYLPDREKDREFTEYFRRIKRPLVERALSGNTTGNDPRILMIASALPGDGKTFTSINLALSLAHERDISVLLVDADAAKQHTSGIFGLNAQRGLLDALADETLDPESLVLPTNVRGLSLLPVGRRVENATELFSSGRMRNTVNAMCAYNPRRIILLDSPPLLITNESQSLVKVAGQVVLVVRAGVTPKQAVQACVNMFDATQAGGIVLNQVRSGLRDTYYAYGAYGAYGYGTEADDK
jgi:protein-tyrosine kinase